jgi:hypothetical protein
MKKGFLLTAEPRPASFSEVLQPVEADECPICLESLHPTTSLMYPCRHLVCEECTRGLWAIRREGHPSTQYLECPLCRELLRVVHGNLAAFIAAHARTNFGPTKATALPASPRTNPAGGLGNLSVHELKIAATQLDVDLTGAIERSDIERSIESTLDVSPSAAIKALPPRCLRAILQARAIPHAECVEKEELAKLVLLSPKGSCLALPAGLLKRMLAALGHAGEGDCDLEKDQLARRVMLVRALARSAPPAQQTMSREAGGPGDDPMEAVGAVDDGPSPPCCCCCGPARVKRRSHPEIC